jgi:hypothetical protein
MSILNEKGNLSLALALCIISVLSSVTLALVSSNSNSRFIRDMEYLQESILERSEVERAFSVLEHNLDLDTDMRLPSRRIIVNGIPYARAYDTYSEIIVDEMTDSNGTPRTHYNLKGYAQSRGWNHNSPNPTRTTRYTDAEVVRLSIAGFVYFSDNEMSTNDSPVYFWGFDIISGLVHSNTDIIIANCGSNEYNGPWPCFFNKVTTAGSIQWYNSAGPLDQIFRGGYEENVSPIEFPSIATDIRIFAQTLHPTGDILLVRSWGASIEAYLAIITYSNIDTLYNLVEDPDIWTDSEGISHPYDLVRDRTAVNLITHRDTVWSSYTLACPPGGAILVDGPQLWLEGEFTGAQTWACADTLYITGNITLSGTEIGDPPDDTMSMNDLDYIGIVSEKSILIKYGMPDVFEGPLNTGYYPRRHPNSDDIYIYAALCALGDGEGNPNYDGVFSFEYQHPHASTTPLAGVDIYDPVLDTVFTNQCVAYPDLQGMSSVNGYQPTGYGSILPYNGVSEQNNWPGDLDYPFYNPLYPENLSDVTQYSGERGTIHLFGSVSQRRRGYIARSSDANPNHTQNIWSFNDVSITGIPQYGGTTQPGSLGYYKTYNHDSRFFMQAPPYFPRSNQLVFVDYNKVLSESAYHQNDN